ncbi:hypothetical protein D9611_009511 [Ephemerocybe angulata]|uniref:Ribonuclease H1 N-terminal domain-containing protein n=1 Tax=Ephemerocybe angulata TaxID=980116 RepID=A0A8H5AVR9_9AGAR|nr:hypothetical protein D9611_009511 [Tulosesus angulatus]
MSSSISGTSTIAIVNLLCQIHETIRLLLPSGEVRTINTGAPEPENSPVVPQGQDSTPEDDNQLLLDPAVAPPTTDERWWVVVVGREPGVFSNSSTLDANVHKIPKARIEKFRSELDARNFYRDARNAGQVIRVSLTITEEVLGPVSD